MNKKIGDYEILQEIVVGVRGNIYIAKNILNQKKVVLKERVVSELGRGKDILHEYKILKECKHPNIIECLGFFLDKGRSYMIFEWAVLGDLQLEVEKKKKKGTTFVEICIWDLLAQLSSALVYLHNKKIIHRDIKSKNILIFPNNIYKLCDFGVSHVVDITNVTESIFGTPLYMSPEQVTNHPYSEKIDMWSLGIVLYVCYLFILIIFLLAMNYVLYNHHL
jgi:serine/threonine protein kinase